MYGGAGEDSVYSHGDGDNMIFGGADNDDLYVYGDGDNQVYGGADEDYIYVGGDGNNMVDGGAGNDDINIYGDGDNMVYGGDGDDDIYIDGDGDNMVYGGAGADTFEFSGSPTAVGTLVFGTGDGADEIINFDETSGNHKVDLSALGFADADDVLDNMTQDGGDTVLFVTAGQTVTFDGVDLVDLQSADPDDWLIL